MSEGYASDASGDSANKRRRTTFAPTVGYTPLISAFKTPLLAAKGELSARTSTLQKDLATIVRTAGEDFLLKRVRLLHKTNKFNEMKDDRELIPASCKIKLDLKVRPETSKSEGYLALSSKRDATIKACHEQLRDLVVDCTKLNVDELSSDVIKTFVINLSLMIEGFLAHDNVMKYSKHRVFVDLFESNYADIAQHLSSTREATQTAWRLHHNLTSLPSPSREIENRYLSSLSARSPNSLTNNLADGGDIIMNDDTDNGMTAREAHTDAQNNPRSTIALPFGDDLGVKNIFRSTVLAKIRDSATLAYSTIWFKYLQVTEENACAARIKKLVNQQGTSSKADDTLAILNAEGHVDPKCLDALLEKKAAQLEKKFDRKLQSLQSQLKTEKAKNSQRGQGGAAKPKKSSTRRGTATPPSKNAKDEAAVPERASSAARERNNKNRSSKQSVQKKKQPNTKGSKPNSQSKKK